MVEMVEILDGRLGKRSVERVRYVINNLLQLVIVKYGDISLVLCISTRLRLVTILSLLMSYYTLTRVISLIYHAKSRLNTPVWGSLRSPNYTLHARWLLASKRSERDTLRSVHSRIVDIYSLLEKWFPLWGERIHSLKLFCMYDKRFEI